MSFQIQNTVVTPSSITNAAKNLTFNADALQSSGIATDLSATTENGHVLTWNAATEQWESQAGGGGGGTTLYDDFGNCIATEPAIDANDENATANVFVGVQAGVDGFTCSESVIVGAGAGGDTAANNGRVAIGASAGADNQGAHAIAIGYHAGEFDQPANSIILNASGAAIAAPLTEPGLYVTPVRDTRTPNLVFYNTTSKELSYASSTDALVLSRTGTTQNTLPAVYTPTGLETVTRISSFSTAQGGTFASLDIENTHSEDDETTLTLVRVRNTGTGNYGGFLGNRGFFMEDTPFPTLSQPPPTQTGIFKSGSQLNIYNNNNGLRITTNSLQFTETITTVFAPALNLMTSSTPPSYGLYRSVDGTVNMTTNSTVRATVGGTPNAGIGIAYPVLSLAQPAAIPAGESINQNGKNSQNIAVALTLGSTVWALSIDSNNALTLQVGTGGMSGAFTVVETWSVPVPP